MTEMHTISSSQPIKLCFLGCGNITAAHTKTLKKLEKGIEIGYASRMARKAEMFQQKFKGDKSYGSYEEAVTDPWSDVIMICLPPVHHFKWAKQALLNNKHVIIEKPAVVRTSEFDELIDISQKVGYQLMVAENYYYRPLRTFLETHINDGSIGEPLAININAVKRQKSEGWRANVEECPMGALFEGGIHWISIINNIGLDFVKYEGFFPNSDGPLDRTSFVTFESRRGAQVNFLYSWEGKVLINGLGFSKIFGTKGVLKFENNGIFASLRGKRFKIWMPSFGKLTGFRPMFVDFIKALRSGELPSYDYLKARKDLQTVENIYKSKT